MSRHIRFLLLFIVCFIVEQLYSGLLHAGSFTFPALTGIYSVGTRTLHFIDKSMGNREFMAQAWYPAEIIEGKTALYAQDFLIDFLKNDFRSSGFCDNDLKEFDSILVQSTYNVPISNNEATYPLIIFSPGYRCSRFYYTAICEDLASHGYITVVIDHPNYCILTQFFDGRLFWTPQTPFLTMGKYFDESIEWLVGDVRFVIDQMTECGNKIGGICFAEKIDATKIGVLGHSLGSAIAIQSCLRDSRIKAVISMDGVVCGSVSPESFNIPSMSLSAEYTAEQMKDETRELISQIWACKHRQYFSYQNLCKINVILKHAGHMIFTDFALLKHLNFIKKSEYRDKSLGTGNLDGFKAVEIIRCFVHEFFDRSLNGKISPLLSTQEHRYSEYVELLAV